jgi:hypothetical protein
MSPNILAIILAIIPVSASANLLTYDWTGECTQFCSGMAQAIIVTPAPVFDCGTGGCQDTVGILYRDSVKQFIGANGEIVNVDIGGFVDIPNNLVRLDKEGPHANHFWFNSDGTWETLVNLRVDT